MKLYYPGVLPWDETQAVYHALAQTGQEGLVICRPSSRCVCLGLHDDLAQEVDTRYCRERDIPLIRRDIGGGTVLLGPEQVFFQLVLSRDNPLLTGNRSQFFGRFLQPAVNTLADFQLAASIAPPADIVLNGRKISGNGAGDIGGMVVYTGNILLAFDRDTMAGVLKVPDDRFRELTRIALERGLTTLSEELGYLPDCRLVETRLIDHFSAWLGELQPAEYTEELKLLTQAVAKTLTSREFLVLPGKRGAIRQIKINEETYLRFEQVAGRRPAQSAYSVQLVENGVVRNCESMDKPRGQDK